MIANFFVLGFILLMALLWSKYGLFSALIHLVCVLVAGTVAFATWEIVAEAFLSIELLANNAWGTAIALVFSITLLILRVISDKVAKQNMHFAPQLDSAGGFVLGALSGVITTGIIITACFPFLHFPEAKPLGYGPYILNSGKVEERKNQDGEAIGNLWIPVDQIVNDLYMSLSDGAFTPTFGDGTTLYSTRVNLKVQASMYHTDADLYTKLAVPDEAFEIVKIYKANVDELNIQNNEIKKEFEGRDRFTKVIVVETKWQRLKQISDSDRTFRLYPTQSSIVGNTNDADNNHVEYKPICYTSQVNNNHYITPLNDNGDVAWMRQNNDMIRFVFLTTDEFQAKNLLVSNTRKSINIESITSDPTAVEDVLALTPFNQASTQADAGDTSKLPREDNGVEVTNKLPIRFSRAGATRLNYFPYKRGKRDMYYLDSGTTEFNTKEGAHKSVKGRNVITELKPGAKTVWVRTSMEAKQAKSLFKKVLQNAERTFRISLVEQGGGTISPVGYVIVKKTRDVLLNIGDEITAASQLPWGNIESGDMIHLFFSVPVGTHLVKYNKAPGEIIDIDLRAFKKEKR